MITKIATIFIKQANPYEDYDDVTVFTDNPTAQAAALTGIGVTGGAVGGGVYGLRKLRKAKGAVADLLTGDAATLAGDADVLNNDAKALESNKKIQSKYVKDIRGNRKRSTILAKKLQPLEKRHIKLVTDLIPNSSSSDAKIDFQAELTGVRRREKIIKTLQKSNDMAHDVLTSHLYHDKHLQDKLLKQQTAHQEQLAAHQVAQLEHQAQQELLNSAKSKLKYIGKPAAIGAGLLGTGTLAYGLYNKLKHS